MSPAFTKPLRRRPKPRKPIQRSRAPIARRKPLGWKRREAKRNELDPDMLQAVIDWYGGHCAYCRHRVATQWDHVEPIARGGEHRISNIVPACEPCNTRKGTLAWVPERMHPYA